MDSKPVAGYYRVSVARDGMKAPELYEDEIRRFCAYKRFELARMFCDIDHSAFRGARRPPELDELVRRHREFSAVVIPKLSRFGRSVRDLVTLFELFDADGVALVFLDMNVDTTSSQGRLLRNIMAAFAEYESDVKSDYTRASQRLLAESGIPVGPRAPYGYVKDPVARTYRIEENEAAIVREIYQRHVDGESLSSIARDLNRRGIRGKEGGHYNNQHLRRLLDSPAYIGMRRYGGELFPGNWEPLVERVVWDEALRIRQTNSRSRSPGVASYRLSSLIVCGVCGHTMYHKRDRRQRRYYCPTANGDSAMCSGRTIAAERAEELVSEAFFKSLDYLIGPDLRLHVKSLLAGWESASERERMQLLRQGIDRVEVIPRPVDNPQGRGLPSGRPIKVVWNALWITGGHPAETVLPQEREEPANSKGKTWAEWQRELRSRSVAFGAATSPGKKEESVHG